MNNDFVWGGARVGFLLIAALGVLLYLRSGAIRRALAPYIGERPARWAVYAAWFGYLYSALYAAAQVLRTQPSLQEDGSVPTALSFGYGVISQAVVPFLGMLVPFAHTVALVVAGVLLYRHLRARAA